VYGGKPSDIEALTDFPFQPDARTRWNDAVGSRPDEDIIQVKCDEIGILFQLFPEDAQIQAAGDNLVKALALISQRRTTIRLQKHSDIATLRILTDGVIMRVVETTDPLFTYDPSSHTVTYGKATTVITDDKGNTSVTGINSFTNDYATKVSSSVYCLMLESLFG
jgi:hypothetical protein